MSETQQKGREDVSRVQGVEVRLGNRAQPLGSKFLSGPLSCEGISARNDGTRLKLLWCHWLGVLQGGRILALG